MGLATARLGRLDTAVKPCNYILGMQGAGVGRAATRYWAAQTDRIGTVMMKKKEKKKKKVTLKAMLKAMLKDIFSAESIFSAIVSTIIIAASAEEGLEYVIRVILVILRLVIP